MKREVDDARARCILRNAVIRARTTLLTDASDLLSLCDDLGRALQRVDGEWPDFEIEEQPVPKRKRPLWSGDRKKKAT